MVDTACRPPVFRRRCRAGNPSRYVGDFSDLPPADRLELRCESCGVHWIGGADAPTCPECGDTSCFDQFARCNPDLKSRLARAPVAC
jgi:hypothetical protein